MATLQLPDENLKANLKLFPLEKVTEKKIFVNIASYRDVELLPTIKSAVQNAKFPHNLIFGVCYQYKDPLEVAQIFEKTLKKQDFLGAKLYIHYQKGDLSQGMGWARNIASNAFKVKTDFILQIDSHMRFRKNWDIELLKEYVVAQNLSGGNRRIILSAPCYDYLEAEIKGISINQIFETRQAIAPRIGEYEPSRGTYLFSKAAKEKVRDVPLPCETISGHFLFSISDFLEEVPYDPQIYWNGEEVSIAIRAWTAGYDLFAPTKVLLLHQTVGSLEKLGRKHTRHFQYKDFPKDWGKLNRRSINRINQLLGISSKEPPKPYGLGSVRSREQYYDYIGRDLREI